MNLDSFITCSEDLYNFYFVQKYFRCWCHSSNFSQPDYISFISRHVMKFKDFSLISNNTFYFIQEVRRPNVRRVFLFCSNDRFVLIRPF